MSKRGCAILHMPGRKGLGKGIGENSLGAGHLLGRGDQKPGKGESEEDYHWKRFSRRGRDFLASAFGKKMKAKDYIMKCVEEGKGLVEDKAQREERVCRGRAARILTQT